MFVKREENIKSSPLETHKIKKLQFKTHLWSAKIDAIQKMASSKNWKMGVKKLHFADV